MALLGQGVLAIWNGIAAAAEQDFVAWHVREHIPERVALPGFLRGRRYVAVAGRPKYFNFYETDTAAALISPEYLARLDDPTPWTRRVVAQFQETTRTICDVAATIGRGEGGWIETIRLRSARAPDDLGPSLDRKWLAEMAAAPGIVAVHVLRGRPSDSGAGSAEKALRGEPDRVAERVMLVEAVEADCLAALRAGLLADEVLIRRGAAADIERGTYRLQFALTKAALAIGSPPGAD
jgi:hypothetical protein